MNGASPREIVIEALEGSLGGSLYIPEGARALVVFAHGSGSSRHSPRNREVSDALNRAGLATLLMDLLTKEEERVDSVDRRHRFDIPLLARRVALAVGWADAEQGTRGLATGLFGASTGAAAALIAAALDPDRVGAVVSRGGRPDLAGDSLGQVAAPTLLIVGGMDEVVIDLNRQAFDRMPGDKKLEIVPGAGHLFGEPGKLEIVSELAAKWFRQYLL